MAYLPNQYRLLGRRVGVDMNSTADQAIPISASKYYIDKVIVTNASISLTTAAGGLYTATAKGGSQIIGSTQVYSGLTTSAKILYLTSLLTSDTLTGATIYVSLTTAQGAAATADWYIYGYEL